MLLLINEEKLLAVDLKAVNIYNINISLFDKNAILYLSLGIDSAKNAKRFYIYLCSWLWLCLHARLSLHFFK